MKKFLMYGLLPTLVFSIALIQLYNSKTTALSPWKGGGFGMYTNIHPFHRKIVIDNKVLEDSMLLDIQKRYGIDEKKVLVNPTPQNIKKFIEQTHYDPNLVNVQIYKARTSLENHSLKYDSLIYEIKNTTTSK